MEIFFDILKKKRRKERRKKGKVDSEKNAKKMLGIRGRKKIGKLRNKGRKR